MDCKNCTLQDEPASKEEVVLEITVPVTELTVVGEQNGLTMAVDSAGRNFVKFGGAWLEVTQIPDDSASSN